MAELRRRKLDDENRKQLVDVDDFGIAMSPERCNDGSSEYQFQLMKPYDSVLTGDSMDQVCNRLFDHSL